MSAACEDKYGGHAFRVPAWQWQALAIEAARQKRKPTDLLKTIIATWIESRESDKAAAENAQRVIAALKAAV